MDLRKTLTFEEVIEKHKKEENLISRIIRKELGPKLQPMSKDGIRRAFLNPNYAGRLLTEKGKRTVFTMTELPLWAGGESKGVFMHTHGFGIFTGKLPYYQESSFNSNFDWYFITHFGIEDSGIEFEGKMLSGIGEGNFINRELHYIDEPFGNYHFSRYNQYFKESIFNRNLMQMYYAQHLEDFAKSVDPSLFIQYGMESFFLH